MADELYRLQESQIKALGEAKWWALTIYGWLHRFFFGLKENRPPHKFADAIEELLDYRYQDGNCPPEALETRLKTIGFFIERVRIPVKVPWFACGQKVAVLSSDCPSAHEGAVRLWDAVRDFLRHEVMELCPELGLGFNPRDAARCLMPHCDSLRRHLGGALEFDLDGLAEAIKQESQAAMEVCNASAFSAVAGRTAHSRAKSEGNGAAETIPPKPREGDAADGKKRNTRKKRSNPKADKTIAQAWNTGQYRTEAALASELQKPEREIHLARERHRKREAAKEKARRK